MRRDWSFLVNPFLNVTEGSYKQMKSIALFTFNIINNKLPPEPTQGITGSATITLTPEQELFVKIHGLLQPLITKYNAQYDLWITSSSKRKSQTTRLTDLFTKLRSEKIRDWDIAIQTVYKLGSPEYVLLLPNRRAPFQRGSQQARLEALESLASLITGDNLIEQDLKDNITDFQTEITGEYYRQMSSKSFKLGTGLNIEPVRKELATALYQSLGYLIGHYGADTATIGQFFDLERIRSFDQIVYRREVKAGGTMQIVRKTFSPNDSLMLQNAGQTTLAFRLSANLNDVFTQPFVMLEPGTERIVNVAELGKISSRHLMVRNEHMEKEGHYVVEVE